MSSSRFLRLSRPSRAAALSVVPRTTAAETPSPHPNTRRVPRTSSARPARPARPTSFGVVAALGRLRTHRNGPPISGPAAPRLLYRGRMPSGRMSWRIRQIVQRVERVLGWLIRDGRVAGDGWGGGERKRSGR